MANRLLDFFCFEKNIILPLILSWSESKEKLNKKNYRKSNAHIELKRDHDLLKRWYVQGNPLYETQKFTAKICVCLYIYAQEW
jgi:hypothetical protein